MHSNGVSCCLGTRNYAKKASSNAWDGYYVKEKGISCTPNDFNSASPAGVLYQQFGVPALENGLWNMPVLNCRRFDNDVALAGFADCSRKHNSAKNSACTKAAVAVLPHQQHINGACNANDHNAMCRHGVLLVKHTICMENSDGTSSQCYVSKQARCFRCNNYVMPALYATDQDKRNFVLSCENPTPCDMSDSTLRVKYSDVVIAH
jgi:hypothetical protein